MRKLGVLLGGMVVAVILSIPLHAQRPQEQAHLDAYVKALSSGSADAFEAMAREHLSTALLARPADSRRQQVERVHADFGELTIVSVTSTGRGHFELTVKGTKNDDPLRLSIDLEPTPPYKIARIAAEVGAPAGGGRGAPPLPAPPVNARMTTPEIAQKIDAYTAGLTKQQMFAGVVLVAKDGREILQQAYGVADRERHTAMATTLRFNIASIGKAFTKVAIGQLIAAGKLSETDTIGKLLPDYPNAEAKPATIEQLLNHRGGIADFFGDTFANTPKDRFQSNHDYFEFVARQPLTFPPGSRNQYCNGCYVVLGEIIAKVSGTSYERYVQDHVFASAGMSRTGFLSYRDADVAPGYTRATPSDPWQRNDNRHGAHGSAAGGAFSTASDLLAFDNAVRDAKLLDPRMTAWYFGGTEASGRRAEGVGIAGGAAGANADLESNGAWTIVVVGNLDPPNAVGLGGTLARALMR